MDFIVDFVINLGFAIDFSFIADIISNTQGTVEDLLDKHGQRLYLILFLIIFLETGIVFFPFLPGDGLLLAVGVVTASSGGLDITTLILVLIAAAILGNTSNYFIGRFAGHQFLKIKNKRFHSYLDRTNEFYDKHGGKAVAISRFFPIVRTYVPFVAGITKMNFISFTFFNVVGGISWVIIFTLGGYMLGDQAWFRDNFTFYFSILMFMTTIPFIVGAIKNFRAKRAARLNK